MLTIVIGLSACLLVEGFMSYTLWGLREALINGGLGHIQLYQQGYLEHGTDDPYQYLITDSKTDFRAIKSIPGVKLYAPRLNFQGMVSYGEKSAVFMGTAGVPHKELALNTQAILKKGSFLSDKKPYGVVIGSGLARKLNVDVGDMVTLTSALQGGGVNALDMEVIGIIEVQVQEYNDVVLFANLPTVQSFVGIPNSMDRMIILLNKTENLGKTLPIIRRLCKKLGLEYLDWRKMAGKQYTQPKMFYDTSYILIMSIIVLVVIFSITNTLNLAMHERVREIGTIRSLGTTRLQVGKIFISESFLIGLIGGFLGIIAGYVLAAFFNMLGGVHIPPPPGQARGYIAFFKPNFLHALQLWMLFLVTATVAGFYPAYKAARLQIVEALRWI
jgi:putative ABC transport system permease protein